MKNFLDPAFVGLASAGLTWMVLSGFNGLAASWAECHQLRPCPASAVVIAEAR